ncbi:MAG: DUF3352 domain-containing protein [Lentisphaerae bacterium]|nr:DUF3352 domain-containing protein [Lentisphaerota bacterium]
MTKKQTLTTLAALIALPLSSFALERIDLIPSESPAYIRISNIEEGVKMVEKTPFGKLWADKQVQDFLGNPLQGKTWEELFAGKMYDDAEMAKAMQEEIEMNEGEFIVSFDAAMEDSYVIAAMSREDFFRSLELDQKLSEQDPVITKKYTFQGEEVVQYIYEAGTEWEYSSWQAQLNDTLVLGPKKEWVERSIIELKKEKIEEPQGAPSVTANFEIKKFINQLLSESEGADQAEIKSIISALGLADIDKCTMNLSLKEDEVVLDGILYARRIDRGLFTLFDTRPANLPTAGFIPNDFSLLEVGRMDLPGFWKEVKRVVAEISPELQTQIDSVMTMFSRETGVDFEMDLLAHMGTEYTYYSLSEGERVKDLVAFSLKNSDAIKRTIEAILRAPAVKPQAEMIIETVDFLDHTLYLTSDLVTEPEAQLAFSVIDGYLIIGNTETVQQALRSVGKPSTLSQNPIIRNFRNMIPSTAFRFSLFDAKRYIKFLAELMQTEEYIMMLDDYLYMNDIPISLPDLTKMPPAEHLASFFETIYSYSEKTPEGIHIRAVIKN